jgi:hypothetical protein
MSDDIVTRLRLHYHKQVKLDPRMKPFIRISRWGGFTLIIGRREFGVLWR